MPAEGSRSARLGVEETGAYELVVETDTGQRAAYPFSVEEYDLRMGSNIVVEVGSERRVLTEE